MNESILPAGVADVALILAQWPALQAFYLAGGTALALQRGHRQSRDLDFFTQEPLHSLPSLPSHTEFAKHFEHLEKLNEADDQVHYRLNDIFVTFLAYPFEHDFPFKTWRQLAIGDARDIVIQKAYTIGGRAQARDYLDMHEALTSNVLSLKSLIEHAKHIYGENFSTRLFLQQLAYTQDLPDKDAAVALLTVPRTFESVERDLQILVRHYVQDTMTTHSVRKPRGPGL